MRYTELSDEPEFPTRRHSDDLGMERRIQEAGNIQAGTFRYFDPELDGEVHTSAIQAETYRSERVIQRETVEWSRLTMVQAEIYQRDGTLRIAGTACYSISGDAAIVQGDRFIASSYGVESALLSEIQERACAYDLKRLLVWVPDEDADAAIRWQSHGFQPTQRLPGAPGVYWEKPL